jgi:uncharacterized protein (UPF0276 family)
MLPLQSLPKLGVGINYHWDFQALIRKHPDVINYIEVSPDILCEEVVCDEASYETASDEKFIDNRNSSADTHGKNKRSFRLDKNKLHDVFVIGEYCPVVVHGLGLSIGSASGWNRDYLTMLNQFAQQQLFPWHSEHLGFTLVKNQDETEDHAGLLLPMPFTQEALDLLCPRIQHLCTRYQAPFLIENTTYYLPEFSRTAEHWDEIDFLNQLLKRTRCGLLLDVYNFYCNAINFGFDPYAALARLQLDRVVEIHVAGGVTHEGFLLDVHSSEVPDAVWELLEWLLPKLPNLCAITYEALEQALPLMGEAKIVAQLEHCKTLWDYYLQSTAHSYRHYKTGALNQEANHVAA